MSNLVQTAKPDGQPVSHVKTVAEFATKIMDAWHRSFDGIIEAGRLWSEAQRTLSRDELAELKSKTKFSDPTISKLVSIATDPRITDPKYRAIMPSSYGTLYEVHHLTDFEAAIKENVLRPDVEREEIIAFRENRHSSRAKATGPTLVTIWLKQETPTKSEVKSLQEALATLIELPSIGFNLSPRYARLVKEAT